MNSIKRKMAGIICLIVILSLFCAFAAAEPVADTVRIDLEDGSYCIITLTVQETPRVRSGRTTVSATKIKEYYDGNDKLVWSLSVHGTFTYDGTTAEATAARYSYEINDSDWSFKSGSASYSSATATANGTFLYLKLWPNTDSVSLTCSPKGVLS